MRSKKKIGLFVLVALWLALSVAAWFWPRAEISNTERRRLAQFPTTVTRQFPTQFDAASLDQFPMRELFRRGKALVHYRLLGQLENNGIYLVDGSAAPLLYPLDQASVDHAIERLDTVYTRYLTASQGRIFLAVAPDKGYYLAGENGYPAMDYEKLFTQLQEALPFATYVDLTGTLTADDYYRTDPHWRQECLFPAAQALAQAMDIPAPQIQDFTVRQAEQPFYGAYYGQAALPMGADTICILENELLNGCTMYNQETGKTTGLYDWEQLDSRDPYEVYLSGAAALLTIENPMGASDRELIIFRDSFGSSLTPLLLASYGKITLVDLRYLPLDQLENYVDFHGQDVLMLYSTIVLQNSFTIK